MLSITATSSTRDLAATRARLRQVVPLWVKRTAVAIEASAKQRAPVDTGALRNSIQWHSLSATEAIVTVGVSYGIWVEWGSRGRRAIPFFTPAVEQVRRTAVREFEQLLRAG